MSIPTEDYYNEKIKEYAEMLADIPDIPDILKFHLYAGIPVAFIDTQHRLRIQMESGETIVLSKNTEEVEVSETPKEEVKMTMPEMLRYLLETDGVPIIYTDDRGRLVEEMPDGELIILPDDCVLDILPDNVEES